MNPFPDRGRGRETLSKNVRSEDKAQAMLRAFFPVPEAPKDGHVLGRLAKRDTDVMGCAMRVGVMFLHWWLWQTWADGGSDR